MISATEVSKKYYRPTKNASHFEAVKPISLNLEKGRITEITGRSGSGKSTLLYMLAGLLRPTQGKVLWEGCDIYALNDGELSKKRNAASGVVPQGQTGLFALTVLENVKLPAMLYGNSDAVDLRARELLEQLGLGGLMNARIQELSGGELRRMAVARALVMEPEYIFADEPTDDLDDESTRLVLSLLRLRADGGAAVLLVTHEAEAEKYADTLYRMDGGLLKTV